MVQNAQAFGFSHRVLQQAGFKTFEEKSPSYAEPP